jgi:Uma2 family endonuclease
MLAPGVIHMRANIEPILTIADVEAMPEDGNRYEVIEGELFMSRAPSLRHQRIVRNIDRAFGRYLDQNPIGETIPGPGVIFSDISGVIPDLVYISNKRRSEIASGDRVEGSPDLIVEILSPGKENISRDRQAKRQLYSKYSVKEYWIVDPDKQIVEIYRAPKFKLPQTLRIKEKISSPLLPGFLCPVQDIFKS